MLDSRELEQLIKDKIHNALPESNAEQRLNFCIGKGNSPEGIYVYSQDHKYHYVEVEKGNILCHEEYISEDDILYTSINAIIFQLALDYEKTHRQSGKDCRRILFAKLIELYSKFGKEFGERKAAEIEEILREHPYQDEFFL